MPFRVFMFACVQVFQTEYNQVIDVLECPVLYIRYDLNFMRLMQHALMP